MRLLSGAILVCIWLVTLFVGFLGISDIAARLRETANAADIAPPTGRFVETRKGRIYIQEAGPADGKPVLLVHGTAVWSEAWRPTMTALAAAGYRAVAFDVPPFGFSDRPDPPAYARADQADRIIDLLDAMTWDRAIVVAHSIGARGAAEAIFRAPGRFAGAILVCGALGLDDDGSLPEPVRFLFDHPGALDPLTAATATNPLMTKMLFARLLVRKTAADDAFATMAQAPMRLRHSTRDFGQWLKAVFSPDPTALSLDRTKYGTLAVPLALIWGEQDSVTPLGQAKEIVSLTPATTLRIIPGVGHVPQVEDFPAFRDALIAALADMRMKPAP